MFGRMQAPLRAGDVPLTVTWFDPKPRLLTAPARGERTWNREDFERQLPSIAAPGTDASLVSDNWCVTSLQTRQGVRADLTFAELMEMWQEPYVFTPRRFTLRKPDGTVLQKDYGKNAVPLLLGGTAREDRRAGEFLEELCLLLVDVDKGMTIEQAEAELRRRGHGWGLATTGSHTPEHHKFRIAIPLSRRVTPDEYVVLATRVGRVFGADPCTKSKSQSFFMPSVRAGNEVSFHVALDVDSPALDVECVLREQDPGEDNPSEAQVKTAATPGLTRRGGRPVQRVFKGASTWDLFPDLTGSGRGGVRRMIDPHVRRHLSRYIEIGPIAVPRIIETDPVRRALLNEPLVAFARVTDVPYDVWRTIAQSVIVVCRGLVDGDAVASEIFHEISSWHSTYDFDETENVLEECRAYLETPNAGPRLYPNDLPGFTVPRKVRTPAAFVRAALNCTKVTYTESLYTGALAPCLADWTASSPRDLLPTVPLRTSHPSRANLGGWAQNDLFGNDKVVFLRSPMGTGKTTMVSGWKSDSRLFIASSRAQAESLARTYGLNCYLDAIGVEEEGRPRNLELFRDRKWSANLVVVVNSLHHVDLRRYGLIVCDESEALHRAFFNDLCLNADRRRGARPTEDLLRVYQTLLALSSRVIYMDAFLGAATTETVIRLLGDSATYHHVVNTPPTTASRPERVLRLWSHNEVLVHAEAALRTKTGGHIACGSREVADRFYELALGIEDVAAVHITGAHSDPNEKLYLADPTGYTQCAVDAGKRLFVIHTNALTAALSNCHPSMTYTAFIGHYQTADSVPNLVQASGRCRNVCEIDAFVAPTGVSAWELNPRENLMLMRRRGDLKRAEIAKLVGPVVLASMAAGTYQVQVDFACSMRYLGWTVHEAETMSPKTRKAAKAAASKHREAVERVRTREVDAVVNAPDMTFENAKKLSGAVTPELRPALKKAFIRNFYGHVNADVVAFNGSTDAGMRKVDNHAPVRALLEGGAAETGLREKDAAEAANRSVLRVSKVQRAELVLELLSGAGFARTDIGKGVKVIPDFLGAVQSVEKNAHAIAALCGIRVRDTLSAPMRTFDALCRLVGLSTPWVVVDGEKRRAVGPWSATAAYAEAELERYRRIGRMSERLGVA